jgi:hypothetical protein
MTTLRFSKLEKEGWTLPATITQGNNLLSNWADFPSLIEMKKGNLLSHWLENSGERSFSYQIALGMKGKDQIFQRISYLNKNRGKAEHGFVSFVRQRGGIRAFWLDGRNTNKEDGSMILMTRWIDPKGKLSKEGILDQDVCSCCQTSATMTNFGPLVVYRDHSKNEIRDIAFVRWTQKGWSKPALVHKDGWKMPACPVNGPSVDAMGNKVVVSWFTAPKGQPLVRLAFSENGGESFGEAITVDAKFPLGRVAVVRTKKGALIAWFGTRGKQAELRLVAISEKGKMGKVLRVTQLPPKRAIGFPRMVRKGTNVILVWRNLSKKGGLRCLQVEE